MRSEPLGRIGEVTVDRILDSYLLGETMQSWFPEFDREAVKVHEYWLCPTHYDPESGHFVMPVQSWLLRIVDKIVLIDTCLGNDKNRPGLSETHMLTTRYLERLAAAGVHPEDVDYVLCTHLHVDHVGWNTRLIDGRWVPTFPNARYVFSRHEYETARQGAADPATPPFLRNVFADSVAPIADSGKVLLVDGVFELLDCLTVRPAPGHSPGHVRIELRSQGHVALFAGDILHSPVQIPFWQWSSRMCWDKEQAAVTRREALEFCVAENAMLVPGHFEAPHVGRIRHAQNLFSVEFGW